MARQKCKLKLARFESTKALHVIIKASLAYSGMGGKNKVRSFFVHKNSLLNLETPGRKY